MKGLFNTKKAKKTKDPGHGLIIRAKEVLHRWADVAEAKTERLSKRGKLLALSLFILMGVGCSLLSLNSVFRSHSPFTLKVGSIKRPLLQPHTTLKPLQPFDNTHLRLNRFKIFMDSLARSPGGARMRDSIFSMYPGLVDSIAVLERLYRHEQLLVNDSAFSQSLIK